MESIRNNNLIVEIKGPESWWIAKSITISRVVNQSKVNPQRQKGKLLYEKIFEKIWATQGCQETPDQRVF